jgi:hypothetical protein
VVDCDDRCPHAALYTLGRGASSLRSLHRGPARGSGFPVKSVSQVSFVAVPPRSGNNQGYHNKSRLDLKRAEAFVLCSHMHSNRTATVRISHASHLLCS